MKVNNGIISPRSAVQVCLMRCGGIYRAWWHKEHRPLTLWCITIYGQIWGHQCCHDNGGI